MKTKNASARKRMKNQSAMEYLMTYGWAVLILAIVVIALYQLGVFTSPSVPTAAPGTCQVARPNGPNTITQLGLEGVCNGQLPQTVAKFNGFDSQLNATVPVPESGTVTTTAWFYLSALPSSGNVAVISTMGATNPEVEISVDSSGDIMVTSAIEKMCLISCSPPICRTICAQQSAQVSSAVQPDKWYFVGGSFSSAKQMETICLYSTTSSTCNSIGTSAGMVTDQLGQPASFYTGTGFDGYISNVQLYSTVLGNSTLYSMYQEGVGGAPINLQALVGWWPMNENGNDYSGQEQNAQNTNTTYSSLWYTATGYQKP